MKETFMDWFVNLTCKPIETISTKITGIADGLLFIVYTEDFPEKYGFQIQLTNSLIDDEDSDMIKKSVEHFELRDLKRIEPELKEKGYV